MNSWLQVNQTIKKYDKRQRVAANSNGHRHSMALTSKENYSL